MARQKKEDLEKLIGEYSTLERITEILEKNPWNYDARRSLGVLRKNDENFYSETGPDAVKYAADEEAVERQKSLQSKIKYSDLVSMYDGEQLKQLLSMLPPLEDREYSELAKAHKNFYDVKQEWKTGLKIMKRDPESYKRKIASETKGADQYLARGRDESTRKVAYGRVLEATRKLYLAVDKLKEKKK